MCAIRPWTKTPDLGSEKHTIHWSFFSSFSFKLLLITFLVILTFDSSIVSAGSLTVFTKGETVFDFVSESESESEKSIFIRLLLRSAESARRLNVLLPIALRLSEVPRLSGIRPSRVPKGSDTPGSCVSSWLSTPESWDRVRTGVGSIADVRLCFRFGLGGKKFLRT